MSLCGSVVRQGTLSFPVWSSGKEVRLKVK